MTHLSVELLEGVLTGEEVQVHVQNIRLRLTQQRRNPLHHVTRGSFFIFIAVAPQTADPCWLQPVGAGGGRSGAAGLCRFSTQCGAKPLGTLSLRVAAVVLLLLLLP